MFKIMQVQKKLINALILWCQHCRRVKKVNFRCREKLVLTISEITLTKLPDLSASSSVCRCSYALLNNEIE